MRQRMYTFVIYQLSGIQKGIQAGHSWIEYAVRYGDTQDFIQWASKDKTVIILDGGTTNNGDVPGTLQKLQKDLIEIGVPNIAFYEPDLQNATTAISFLVDETVWDTDTYPIIRNKTCTWNDAYDTRKEIQLNIEKYGEAFEKSYLLRKFLSQFKLASN